MNEQDLIKLIKKTLVENNEIHVCDDEKEETVNEMSTVSAIAGVTTPLGTDSTYPNSKRKKQKNFNKSFKFKSNK